MHGTTSICKQHFCWGALRRNPSVLDACIPVEFAVFCSCFVNDFVVAITGQLTSEGTELMTRQITYRTLGSYRADGKYTCRPVPDRYGLGDLMSAKLGPKLHSWETDCNFEVDDGKSLLDFPCMYRDATPEV